MSYIGSGYQLVDISISSRPTYSEAFLRRFVMSYQDHVNANKHYCRGNGSGFGDGNNCIRTFENSRTKATVYMTTCTALPNPELTMIKAHL